MVYRRTGSLDMGALMPSEASVEVWEPPCGRDRGCDRAKLLEWSWGEPLPPAAAAAKSEDWWWIACGLRVSKGT